MCCGVRCTERRTAASSLIFTRLRSARRRRVSRLSSFMCLLLLRFFQRNLLIRILHALALVRLRRPEGADLGRGLADALAIDPLHDDLGLARRVDAHPVRNRIVDQMRIPERQRERLGLHGGAVADADELELDLIALGHARDHVREMSARRACDGVQALRRGFGLHFEALVVLHDLDAVLQLQRQRPLGAFHRHGVGTDRRADALRQIHRLFCNSRHTWFLRNGRPAVRPIGRPYWTTLLDDPIGRPYWTTKSTSPPVPAARACASDMTPLGVDTTATPKPPSTFGSSS